MLAPGTKIDRYRIDGSLGRGGMGDVYRAYDEKLRRHVALKVLLPSDGTHDTVGRARMMREARAAAALHHPNVVAIYDVGEDDETPFIAMELVKGHSLRAVLKEGAPALPPWKERVRWLRDVARALAAAHGAGLVHRDIKPENVLLEVGGTSYRDHNVVKVLDFGIARRIGAEASPADFGNDRTIDVADTVDGAITGTPLYMAPEQVKGAAVDGRTDQFAWGVLGWELLTGTPPWPATDLMSLAAAILHNEPPAIALPPGCPDALEAILRRALAKDPNDRFPSMEEATLALESTVDEMTPASPFASTTPAVVLPSVEESAAPPPERRSASRKKKKTRSKRSPLLNAALIIGGAGLAAFAMTKIATRSPAAPVVAVMEASAATASSTGGVAMTHLPMPSSKNAAALEAYRTGLQAQHDAKWGASYRHYLKAISLDGELAMAHLRAAVVAQSARPTEVRKHFSRAMDLRASLSERDRAMLTSFEPILGRETADDEESTRRFAAAAAKFPNDAELVSLHGYIGRPVLGNDVALPIVRRAVTLDPEFADAWQTVGAIAADVGELGEARDAIKKCIEVSPGAVDCQIDLTRLDELEGKCGDVERGLRDVADDPEHPEPRTPLWQSALIATGKPREAVQQSLDQRWTRLPELHREFTKAMEDAALDVFYGDFATALRKLDDVERTPQVQGASGAQFHAFPTLFRAEIEIEIGKPADAAKHAAAYMKKKDAWTAIRSGPDPTPRLLYIAARGGAFAHAELVRERRAWMDATDTAARPDAWARGFGGAETADEANEALSELPSGGAPKSYFRHLDEAAGVGRVLFLAGKTDESLVVLRVAANACSQLIDPIGHTRANDVLGQALEKKGDTKGACAAYRVVTTRWSSATPRSVTAEHARDRAKSLRCD